MKRVFCVALVLALLLTACGNSSSGESDENLGVYKLKSIGGYTVETFAEMMDQDVSTAGEYIMAELKSGGKCVFTVDGEAETVDWTLNGETITLDDGSEAQEGTLKDGVMTLDLDGQILILAKEGAGGGTVATGLKETLRNKLESSLEASPEPEPEDYETTPVAPEPEPEDPEPESEDPEPEPESEPAASSSEAPNGDGLVSTEDVMKCYVWLSEILGSMSDATYADVAARFGKDGVLTGEEFVEHMDSWYRYYNWISQEDSYLYIHINFREKEGVYRVSGFNSSGFTASEAAELYLDDLQAEANAAEANAPTEEMQVDIYLGWDRDDTHTVIVQMPEQWNYKDVSGSARFYHHPTEASFNYGGGVELDMETELAKFTDKLDTYEDVQEIGQRTIGGVTMDGYTYKSIGYEWIEYTGVLPDGMAVAVRVIDMDSEPGTPAGNLIDSIVFQ